MDCLVLACVVMTTGPLPTGSERVQEQFERHYLQRPELAGPDRSAGLEASGAARRFARRPVRAVVRSAQARP